MTKSLARAKKFAPKLDESTQSKLNLGKIGRLRPPATAERPSQGEKKNERDGGVELIWSNQVMGMKQRREWWRASYYYGNTRKLPEVIGYFIIIILFR